MRRAARAWAAGGDCSMCPLAPVYPNRCVAEDPEELWRDDVEGDGGAECPVYLRQQFKNYFLAWTMVEKGILPAAGGWAQQPYHWVQAFETIGSAVAKVQREQVERLRTSEH